VIRVALPLADGGRGPIDQGVSTFLFLAAFLFGLIAVQRLRDRGFHVLPKAAGWLAAGLAAASLVLAVVLPPVLRPVVAAGRPSSTARLRIVSPAPGATFRGDPARVPVRLSLAGARIVPFTSTKLRPDEGHLHLYLDGALVSMSYALDKQLEVMPGTHQLEAEFVAVDHGPFNPRVRAFVEFRVAA
jgi:hypothetical protein